MPQVARSDRAGAGHREIARARRVLDQDGRDQRIDGAHHVDELLADDDHDARAPHQQPLDQPHAPHQRPGRREVEVRELLRQARVHVVEVRHAEHRRQHHADQAALFVRVDGVVGRAQRPPQRGGGQGGVEGDLGPGRADADVLDQRRPQTPDHREPGHLDVTPERVGDQIDGVTERDERLDAVEFAERGAPRLEERLGRNHQDVHWRPQPTEYTGRLCTRSI